MHLGTYSNILEATEHTVTTGIVDNNPTVILLERSLIYVEY